VKLWTCDKCKTVQRSDDGPPVGWTRNLFPGIAPLCRECQPMPSKGELKREKAHD
jgi:hypothetical protein